MEDHEKDFYKGSDPEPDSMVVIIICVGIAALIVGAIFKWGVF